MPKVVLDFQLGTIYMVNQQLTHKARLTQIYMFNIAVEVEDGLQIDIRYRISLYLRGGCMPKVVLDFRLGTIYMVNRFPGVSIRPTQPRESGRAGHVGSVGEIWVKNNTIDQRC